MIHRFILVATAAAALAACGAKTPSEPLAAAGAAGSAAPSDHPGAVADAQTQWKASRDAIDTMSRQLANDPALMAKQSNACGSAPAQLQPPKLQAPCAARDAALAIVAGRAGQANGGVKNTSSL